jgi:ribosomal protein S18 acetylase RimI-like enzyme
MIAAPRTVAVRSATRADLPRVGRLGALLVEAHHALDPAALPAPATCTAADYAAFLEGRLADPDALVLVAHDREDVVGYAYAEIEGTDHMALRGPAGVLHDLIVDPAHRGRAVGRLLLEAALEALAARGVPRVVLSAAERNAVAQGLFERAGFRRTMVEMTRDA